MNLFKNFIASIILIYCNYQASYALSDNQIVIFTVKVIDNTDKYSSVVDILENMESVESFMLFSIQDNFLHIEATAQGGYNNILDEILQQEKFTIVKESVEEDRVYIDILLLQDVAS